MVNFLSESVIKKAIIDSMFLLPKLTGNGTMIEIPGIRGYYSSLKEPYANRVGLVNTTDMDTKIEMLLDFFAGKDIGFTFAAGPGDIEAGISKKLIAHGVKPARFHLVAGMCLQEPFPGIATESVIRVEEIESKEIGNHVQLITDGYGVSQELSRYSYVLSSPEKEFKSRFYLAYWQGKEEPVGYCSSVYFANNSVIALRGSAVIPSCRGRGIYKAMIQQRLIDATKEGVGTIIVHAARATSYHALSRFGFQEICPIEWYQWSPHSVELHSN